MRYVIVILFSLLAMSCSENKQPESTGQAAAKPAMVMEADSSKQAVSGQVVPNEDVCMVNDTYMGKKQLEVKHDGKTYYGCCEMCQKRIPKDESVRKAVDPVSGKTIDKADAVIAVTGEKGAVSYFENEANYKAYLKK